METYVVQVKYKKSNGFCQGEKQNQSTAAHKNDVYHYKPVAGFIGLTDEIYLPIVNTTDHF